MEPTLCPLCGVGGALKLYGDLVECDNCGAEARFRPDPNLFPLERAHDPLREALLWHWAAEHNAHDWNDCGEDNDATGPGDIPCRTCAEIADMREAAAAEVERLLKEMEKCG